MAKGLFLVGSSRGVGQTLVGVGLVGVLRNMGVDATMMTPITTGGSADSSVGLLERVGVSDPTRLTQPVRFETMAAPYVASRIEERPVSVTAILEAYQELSEEHEFVVVDGGGVLVPISERFFMIDLMDRMGLPSIIIGRTARGTLNHCLLTQRMMMVRGTHPLGFILNGFGQYGEGFAESLNPEVLASLARPTPVLATIEWRPSYPTDVEGLVQALEQQTSLTDVLRGLLR